MSNLNQNFPEELPVALFFTPLIMKMACGAFIYKTYDTMCHMPKKVLFAVLDGTLKRGCNFMDTSNLIFTIGGSIFITIED